MPAITDFFLLSYNCKFHSPQMSRSHMYLVAETTLYILALKRPSWRNSSATTVCRTQSFSLMTGAQALRSQDRPSWRLWSWPSRALWQIWRSKTIPGWAGTGNIGTGVYGLLSGHAETQEKDGIAVPIVKILYKLPKGWHFLMKCHPFRSFYHSALPVLCFSAAFTALRNT